MATHEGKEWSGGQATQVLRVVEESGISRAKLQAILDRGYLSDLLGADLSVVPRERFREVLGLALEASIAAARSQFCVYRLAINYDRSVADGIAAGKYDWVSSDITQEHFPAQRVGTSSVEVYLVHFGWEMTASKVIRELNKLGLRPAKLSELLALGEKYPDLQREFSVAVLGSRWQGSDGRWSVPYLDGSIVGRSLHVRRVDGGWSGSYRFAAVRKSA